MRVLLVMLGLVGLIFPHNQSKKFTPGVDWPQFRGPNASGVAEGFALPTKWDLERSESVQWKVPIPGLGYSSPTIWGDKICVTSAIGGHGADVLPDRSSMRCIPKAVFGPQVILSQP